MKKKSKNIYPPADLFLDRVKALAEKCSDVTLLVIEASDAQGISKFVSYKKRKGKEIE